MFLKGGRISEVKIIRRIKSEVVVVVVEARSEI
jgi:hypothetical protein